MTVLALVTARAGSKRLPGKNTKVLAGKSLVEWTLLAAKHSGVCDRTLVSTDDKKVAAIAKEAGAWVPDLRPEHLSSDSASSADVAIYELDKFENQFGEVEFLILLQPTSPFRNPDTISGALNLLRESGADGVVSVSSSLPKPSLYFMQEPQGFSPISGWQEYAGSAASDKSILRLDGGVFLIKPAALRAHKSFLFPGIKPYPVVNPIESLDIDTPLDWDIAVEMANTVLGKKH